MLNQKKVTPTHAVSTVLILVSFFLASPGTSQTVSDQGIVDSFTPQALIDDTAESYAGEEQLPTLRNAFVTADLDGIGSSNYLVAVYTNGDRAIVRALRKTGDSAVPVSDYERRLMYGYRPLMFVIELDGDGKEEIGVSFGSFGPRRAIWLLRWTADQFVNAGPVSDRAGNMVSASYPEGVTRLTGPLFVDFEDDGAMEIVEDDGSGLRWNVYKASNGSYGIDRTINFFSYFKYPTSNEEELFMITDTCPDYTLRVLNGGSIADGNRVVSEYVRPSNATVKLNGVVLAGPADFSTQPANIIVPGLRLQTSNTLTVSVDQPASSALFIEVQPPPTDPAPPATNISSPAQGAPRSGSCRLWNSFGLCDRL